MQDMNARFANMQDVVAKFAYMQRMNAKQAKMQRMFAWHANVQHMKTSMTNLSGVNLGEADFGVLPMPAKSKPKKDSKAAASRLAKQLGKSMMQGADDDSDGGDESDEDDDDAEGADDAIMTMMEKGVGRMVSSFATLVPHVLTVSKEACKRIQQAVEKAKTELNGPKGDTILCGLDVAATNADPKVAAASIERLLKQRLQKLLDEIFGQKGPLQALIDDAKGKLPKADDDTSGDVGRLVQDLAEMHLPRVLTLLRTTVEKRAEPTLKKLALSVASQIEGFAAPVASLKKRVESAKVAPGDTSTTACREAMNKLLDRLKTGLDDPSAIAQQWLLQQGGKLLQVGGSGLASLGKRAGIFESTLKESLSEEEYAKIFVDKSPGAVDPSTTQYDRSLAAALDAHTRTAIAKRALSGTSHYAAKGGRAMLMLVMSTDPLVLTKHENELIALKEELMALKDKDVTSEGWQDFYESWAAVLALRSKLEGEVAQQIFDAIATDKSVFAGLAGPHIFMDAVMDKAPPNELLLKLKKGPLKHVKTHMYAYRKKIDAEISKIGRVRDLQKRAVALVGTFIIAALVSIGNLLARVYYDVLKGGNMVVIVGIPSALVGTLLLAILVVGVCVRQARK